MFFNKLQQSKCTKTLDYLLKLILIDILTIGLAVFLYLKIIKPIFRLFPIKPTNLANNTVLSGMN
jgi:hypothetical protein